MRNAKLPAAYEMHDLELISIFDRCGWPFSPPNH
jgi:hypothetical protein